MACIERILPSWAQKAGISGNRLRRDPGGVIHKRDGAVGRKIDADAKRIGQVIPYLTVVEL